jgi:transcriptional regulator CtsR
MQRQEVYNTIKVRDSQKGMRILPNLADSIERYFLHLLEKSLEDNIAIQRSSIADKFQCAPSQINYVLEKRFTVERGFLIKSRRGGGGHIMIVRVPAGPKQELLQNIIQRLDAGINQARAEAYLLRLAEAGVLTKREHGLLQSAMQREALALPLPVRDSVRGKLLKAMLSALLENLTEEE